MNKEEGVIRVRQKVIEGRREVTEIDKWKDRRKE